MSTNSNDGDMAGLFQRLAAASFEVWRDREPAAVPGQPWPTYPGAAIGKPSGPADTGMRN